MTAPLSFQRLFPTTAPVSERELDAVGFLAAFERERRIAPDRPHVMANMVASLDGNTTFGGRSAPLSDAGDRALFHALRGSADAILAGTMTLKLEGYHAAAKPIVTLTRSGTLPLEIPLFRDPAGQVIVFSATRPQLENVAARVELEPLSSLDAMLATLRRTYGVRLLLCEGGPAIFGAMIRARLIDELFLTLSPRLAGGAGGPPLASGVPAPELAAMRLASVLERDSTLFLRYLRA